MANVLDMQDIRYLNLFGKITRVDTMNLIKYNEHLVFGVPKNQLSKAIGEKGKNVKHLKNLLKKRLKIVALPKNIEDCERFFRDIINPTEFVEMKIEDDKIIINAGSNNKAALLGRNKRRLLELQKIAKDYFKKDLKIV
ncbi:MAG: hypothetical protein ACOCUU_02230 [Nanoarchaeota archaeon]